MKNLVLPVFAFLCLLSFALFAKESKISFSKEVASVEKTSSLFFTEEEMAELLEDY